MQQPSIENAPATFEAFKNVSGGTATIGEPIFVDVTATTGHGIRGTTCAPLNFIMNLGHSFKGIVVNGSVSSNGYGICQDTGIVLAAVNGAVTNGNMLKGTTAGRYLVGTSEADDCIATALFANASGTTVSNVRLAK